jgi:hypothetical protein
MTRDPIQQRASIVRDATGGVGIALVGAGASAQWGWPVGAMVIGAILLGLVLAGLVRR